jgi:hypothetical protein
VLIPLLPAVPAAAEDQEQPMYISFRDPTVVDVEYGEPWFYQLDADPRPGCCFQPYLTITDSFTGGVLAETYIWEGAWKQGDPAASLDSYMLDAPLSAGEHVLTASMDQRWEAGIHYAGTSTNTATIRVAPAKLAVDMRVEADPVSADQAFVTGRLSGRFIDELVPQPWASRTDPQLPAGTWAFAVSDANGTEAFRTEIPVEAGGAPLVSALWQGVPAGSTFTGTATFTPSGDSAADFEVTGADGVSFTSASAVAPAPAPVDEGAEPAPNPEPVVDTVPLWSLLLLGLLALAGIAGLVVTFLRLRSPRELAEFETAASAPAAPLPAARASAGWATPSPGGAPAPSPHSVEPPTDSIPILEGGRRG